MELETRGSIPPKGKKEWKEEFVDESLLISAPQYAAAGLAGVWAEANTRESLFSAMQAKEVFATSGPRIKVRFFASSNFADDILDGGKMVEKAYASGVAMGGTLSNGDRSPEFLIWGMKDPDGLSLQRAQIIKVTANGERVFDAVCSDGSAPDAQTQRCPDNSASVDISTCKTSGEGAVELKGLWKDPDWITGETASYYVRIIENPKCRWSTWDAVRNQTPPNPSMDATIQDRTWSSPIWVK